jgi:hypothetical protein
VTAVTSFPQAAPDPEHLQRSESCQVSRFPSAREHEPLIDHAFAEIADAAASTLTPTHDTSSLPITNNDPMDIDQPRQNSTDSNSSTVLRELQELPVNAEEDELAPPPKRVARELRPPPAPTCLICTATFEEGDKIIEPCKCGSQYCAACLRKMFLDACKDQTRMPPRCCTIISIHHVRPYFSAEEAALFRRKFEEWNTPNPFYCPVAQCSTFIPNRLLSQTRIDKGKQRVDSGVGTPVSPTIACPQCETGLCTNCRGLAHVGVTCQPLEFGVDKETAELLKAWGYKRCPKCGHGFKRMYGCNHMECRCGAHFCWGCMKSQEECDGRCYDEQEDGYDSYSEPDSEDDDDDDTPADETSNNKAAPANDDVALSEPASLTIEVITPSGEDTRPAETPTDSTAPPAETTTRRVRNLDGGSGSYWEQQALDLGDEPTDEYQDRAWNCEHEFLTTKLKLADSLTSSPLERDMECMKCWCTIHPEIEMPKSSNNGGVRGGVRMVSAGRGIHSTVRGRVHNRAQAPLVRLQGRGFEQPQSQPMNFNRSVPELNTMSQPTEPMEDVQHSSGSQTADRVFDTYGNPVTTTERTKEARRHSVSLDDFFDFNKYMRESSDASSQQPPSTERLSFTMDNSPFSFAYDCDYCGLLVCNSCKDELMAMSKEKEDAEKAAAVAARKAIESIPSAEQGATDIIKNEEAQTSSTTPTIIPPKTNDLESD